jgi:hypothetical protein
MKKLAPIILLFFSLVSPFVFAENVNLSLYCKGTIEVLGDEKYVNPKHDFDLDVEIINNTYRGRLLDITESKLITAEYSPQNKNNLIYSLSINRLTGEIKEYQNKVYGTGITLFSGICEKKNNIKKKF